MIDFLVNAAIVIVVSGLIGLLIWKMRSRPSEYSSIYVESKDKADFWEGKGAPDNGFTASQKKAIYEREGGRCAITGKRLSLGEPDNKRQEWGKVLGVLEEGEIDHRIPREWGGPSKDWNGLLISRKINRKKLAKWTRDAEKLCSERGLKVYVGKRGKKFVS